jgi:sulfatase modifying factor 1
MGRHTVIGPGAVAFLALTVGARAALLPAPPSGVEVTTAYGLEFSTIGDPGNTAFVGGAQGANAGAGAVGLTFRLARTQVTNAQWAEFANAYRPFINGNPDNVQLAPGLWVYYDGAIDGYSVVRGAEDFAAQMSWRMAARYCNWLHNDQRREAWAFETGAYDTSTFGPEFGWPFTDQAKHTPGARFYLPTRDEWFKAAFYDPNRYGEGQGGYWTYVNASDTPLVYGFPEDGGESIAEVEGLGYVERFLPVASYPDTRSAWGLFDLSGSSYDWNEDASDFRDGRLYSGSSRFATADPWVDAVHRQAAGSWPYSAAAGLRVAAAIPAPGVSVTGPFLLILLQRRRR